MKGLTHEGSNKIALSGSTSLKFNYTRTNEIKITKIMFCHAYMCNIFFLFNKSLSIKLKIWDWSQVEKFDFKLFICEEIWFIASEYYSTYIWLSWLIAASDWVSLKLLAVSQVTYFSYSLVQTCNTFSCKKILHKFQFFPLLLYILLPLRCCCCRYFTLLFSKMQYVNLFSLSLTLSMMRDYCIMVFKRWFSLWEIEIFHKDFF